MRKVSARQLLAIDALTCGHDLHTVAEVAKIHRSTLYRWLKYDANFQEELAAQQRAMYGAAMSRGIVAAGDAMDQVVSAVAEGDLNAAIRLLKGLGLFNGRRPDFHYVGEQPTDQPAVQ